MGFLVKVSDLLEKPHKICWFSGCDLHLPEAPGLRKPLAILQELQKTSEIYAFWKNSGDFFENLVSFLAFHFTDWHSSPNEMIFMKNSIGFAGFLAVIFTSQRKNLQKFMHSEKNLEIFWKFCTFFVLKSYYRTRRLGVVRGSDFLEKIHKICWFSGCDFHLPVKKSSAIYAFWTNSGDFSAVAVAMMSNDEQWWVMNADDADDGCWWWCWWSRKLYKQTAELPINRPTGAEY